MHNKSIWNAYLEDIDTEIQHFSWEFQLSMEQLGSLNMFWVLLWRAYLQCCNFDSQLQNFYKLLQKSYHMRMALFKKKITKTHQSFNFLSFQAPCKWKTYYLISVFDYWNTFSSQYIWFLLQKVWILKDGEMAQSTNVFLSSWRSVSLAPP